MDKQDIADAVNLLIAEDSYGKRLKQIEDIIENWDDSPRVFAGKLAALNALVDIGLDDGSNLSELLALVETRRKLVPLMKKVDYQRHLMREKRERLNKAVKLEEVVRGKALTTKERDAYKLNVAKRWATDKDRFIKEKGSISWKERNEATRQFWTSVDEALARDIAEAEAILQHGPVRRKRVVRPEPPVTALSKAFQKAKHK